VNRTMYRRAVAVGTSAAGSILFVREGSDPYWILPGGRVREEETFQEACARELHEELGIRPAIGELAFVLENFFTVQDRGIHEICVAFHVALGVDAIASVERNKRRECRFIPGQNIRSMHILPRVLPELLALRSATVAYRVWRDEPAAEGRA
jgi:ADP-ribose pyrophosphatase YjhB (NUDIX family)